MRCLCLRLGAFFLVNGLLLIAQNPAAKPPAAVENKGLPPRATPNDYAAQASAEKVTLGAEFMGHSVPRVEGPLSTEDYVVVEVGVFGAPGTRVNLSASDFSLRINGKKNPLGSQPFGFVLSSLKDPTWQPPETSQPKSKGGLSTGGGDQNGPPPPVHMPIELQRSMAQYVQQAALPEGDRVLPQAGLLFFSYRGKTQSIHSMELAYSGAGGKASMNLHP